MKIKTVILLLGLSIFSNLSGNDLFQSVETHENWQSWFQREAYIIRKFLQKNKILIIFGVVVGLLIHLIKVIDPVSDVMPYSRYVASMNSVLLSHLAFKNTCEAMNQHADAAVALDNYNHDKMTLREFKKKYLQRQKDTYKMFPYAYWGVCALFFLNYYRQFRNEELNY